MQLKVIQAADFKELFRWFNTNTAEQEGEFFLRWNGEDRTYLDVVDPGETPELEIKKIYDYAVEVDNQFHYANYHYQCVFRISRDGIELIEVVDSEKASALFTKVLMLL